MKRTLRATRDFHLFEAKHLKRGEIFEWYPADFVEEWEQDPVDEHVLSALADRYLVDVREPWWQRLLMGCLHPVGVTCVMLGHEGGLRCRFCSEGS